MVDKRCVSLSRKGLRPSFQKHTSNIELARFSGISPPNFERLPEFAAVAKKEGFSKIDLIDFLGKNLINP